MVDQQQATGEELPVEGKPVSQQPVVGNQSSSGPVTLSAAVKRAGGSQVYLDAAAACSMIDGLSDTLLPPGTKERYRLVLSCTGIGNMLANADNGLTMVQIDAAIQDVVNHSGLGYDAALKVVHDLFASCGIDTALQERDKLDDQGNVVRVQVWPLGEYKREKLAKVATTAMDEAARQEALQRQDDDAYDDQKHREASKTAVSSIIELMRAGEPLGFHLMGICQKNGTCGVAQSDVEAKKSLRIAANNGYGESAALLGDMYYASNPLMFSRNYTTAFHYYTRPGAVALDNPKRIAAIEDIRAQRAQNPVLLGFAAALVVLELLFVVFFHISPVSGASRLVPGIICTVLSAGLVGYGFSRYRKLPFNGQRLLIAGVFGLWALFVFILALA